MVKPVVGTFDRRLAKGIFQFSAGGGKGDDLKTMAEFLKALTRTQDANPVGGDGRQALK